MKIYIHDNVDIFTCVNLNIELKTLPTNKLMYYEAYIVTCIKYFSVIIMKIFLFMEKNNVIS